MRSYQEDEAGPSTVLVQDFSEEIKVFRHKIRFEGRKTKFFGKLVPSSVAESLEASDLPKEYSGKLKRHEEEFKESGKTNIDKARLFREYVKILCRAASYIDNKNKSQEVQQGARVVFSDVCERLYKFCGEYNVLDDNSHVKDELKELSGILSMQAGVSSFDMIKQLYISYRIKKSESLTTSSSKKPTPSSSRITAPYSSRPPIFARPPAENISSTPPQEARGEIDTDSETAPPNLLPMTRSIVLDRDSSLATRLSSHIFTAPSSPPSRPISVVDNDDNKNNSGSESSKPGTPVPSASPLFRPEFFPTEFFPKIAKHLMRRTKSAYSDYSDSSKTSKLNSEIGTVDNGGKSGQNQPRQ